MLLDGGMGQELMKRSAHPPSAMWSSRVMLDEPEIVEAVHRDFLAAGAKVLTINTYSVTPERLARDADESLFEPLQEKAIAVAKAARGDATDVALAGCLPPLFASYHPDKAPAFDIALATYRRIVAIEAPHVDCFQCETMGSVRETRAATLAAAESGKPVWTAISVDDGDGTKMRSGEDLSLGVAAAIDAGASAVLVNCSLPEAIARSIPVLAASGVPFGAYANGFTGIEALGPGGNVESLTARSDLGPQAYADHVMAWVDAGATLVGGCCEVGPPHISELARRLTADGHVLCASL